MRALTIRQPYAWAVAIGRKPVENRTRATSHRGPLAIHAGAAWYPDGDWDQRIIAAWHSAGRPTPTLSPAGWPRAWFGAVLAVADLYDCHTPAPDCCASEWADRAGAHLLLRDVQVLPEPVYARGALGLWTLPPDVEAAVLTQLPTDGVTCST